MLILYKDKHRKFNTYLLTINKKNVKIKEIKIEEFVNMNTTVSQSFKEAYLEGPNAFYNQPDYKNKTKDELSDKRRRPVSYKWNTQNKFTRIIKDIGSTIFFPIGFCRFMHRAAGAFTLPASNPSLLGHPMDYANGVRKLLVDLDGEWKYKRITVRVNGREIDAVIMGKESTLNNGKWTVVSNGNGQFYEETMAEGREIKEILTKTESNAILFNYAGVGASSGMPNRRAMAHTYRAMLNFLEDEKKGIGAKKIIGYGHSIGGGVQEALGKHKFKKDIKYVFVKSRSFSTLSAAGGGISFILRPLTSIFGWNMNSIKASKKLPVPELILQTHKHNNYQLIKDKNDIVNDRVIAAKSSHAYELLKSKKPHKAKKVILGIPENHNSDIVNTGIVARYINNLLT